LSREGGWNASAREEQIRNSMFRNLKNGNYKTTTGFFDYSPRFANELANNLLTIQNNGIIHEILSGISDMPLKDLCMNYSIEIITFSSKDTLLSANLTFTPCSTFYDQVTSTHIYQINRAIRTLNRRSGIEFI